MQHRSIAATLLSNLDVCVLTLSSSPSSSPNLITPPGRGPLDPFVPNDGEEGVNTLKVLIVRVRLIKTS